MLLVLLINVLCALLGGNHRCWGKRGPIISSFITNCVWCSKFALATGLSSEFFSHETCRNGRIAFLLNSSLTPAFTKVFALEVMCQREIVSALLAGRKTSVVAERDREKSLTLPYPSFYTMLRHFCYTPDLQLYLAYMGTLFSTQSFQHTDIDCNYED